jgi:opacity protein-like surface antigen
MRLLATLAVLAATLAAPPALAQGRMPMNGAVLLGFEDGDFDAGISLRGDLELVQRPLAPNVGFSIIGSLGFVRFSQDGGYSYFDESSSWETAINVIKFVPAARLTFGRSQAFRPYVDAGLGLYYGSLTYEESVTFTSPVYPYLPVTQTFEADDSEFSLTMRLAAGLQFQVAPNFSLGGELSINPYFGDYDDSTLGLMVGASFRM